jgi:4-hydroxybenzoate polyprenyltransferase
MKASSVSAYLELARWQNCLIAAAGVVVGAWWVGWANGPAVARAAFAAMALAVATYSINDVMDFEIDFLTKPERPVAGGRISRRRGLEIAVVFALTGIVLAASVDATLGLLTIGVVAVAGVYSLLKRFGLPGNLVVAVLASMPFLYGAWAAGNARGGFTLVAIAAPLHLAREISKDIDDRLGDAGLRRTVPIRWGLPVASVLILVALLAFAVQIIPIVRTVPGFELLILPSLMLSARGALLSAHRRPGAPRAFKAAMLCAMAAFVIARA